MNELLANSGEDLAPIVRPKRLQFLDRQIVNDDFISH